MKQKQIAIVGISLRFPGATTVEQFWNNLMNGTESVERYEEEQLNQFGVHPKSYESEQFVKASARLENIDQFDHNLFNYSPKDAALLDPQQRLLLECGYEALEDAGIPVGSTSHDVGVFAGAYVSNYLIRNLGPMVSERSKSEDNVPFLYQCETDHLATNLAYRLNLTGPSISVQSWCTTAFSALYFGSRAIQNGDCKTAMVGAANIIVPQEGYFAPEGGLWSITGKTRSFDKAGDGCVSGSGVAVVILKELEEAIKDRNQIYALLKGVSVNNDGKSSAKLGYHGATVEGQFQAIKKTLAQSGVGTESITYLEANGLATPLADRMELKALSKAFEGTNEQNKPWLGSIKPNIGHLLSASGMAALIKSCLICKHKMVPPLINHQKLSKVNQRMVDPNFQINYEAIDLSTRRDPIICGMNSFGIGGSNAHAIVQEAPPSVQEKTVEHTPPQLITWSARTAHATEQYGKAVQAHIDANTALRSTDLSYSLNTSKGALAYRQSAVIDAAGKLHLDHTSPIAANGEAEVIWIFTGYGETYPLKKFHGLYAQESVFRSVMDHFFKYVYEKHEKHFKSYFFNPTDTAALDAEFKSNVLTIILNYAYAKQMMHWGIRPSTIVGISNGEYTAACLASVFTFEEMIDVVIRQSEAITSLPEGKMITVITEKENLLPLLEANELDLGGTYLPNVQVVAGNTAKCERFRQILQEKGLDYLPIASSFAFHSREVDPILEQLESLYKGINFQPPRIPLFSTVTGQAVKEEIMQPAYWSKKIREPVLFAEAMSNINPENAVFAEFGPGDKYSPVLKYLYDQETIDSYSVINSQTQDAYESLLSLLGKIWQHGIVVDWQQFYVSKPGQKIAIPHYPFERQSFWLDYSKEQPEASTNNSSCTKQPFENWFYTPNWKPLIQATRASSDQLGDSKTWLVFTNGEQYTEDLIQWLGNHNQKVISVAISESFQATAQKITANPYEGDGLQQVFNYLHENCHLPDHVLYFWCHEAEATKESYRTLAYSTIIELVQGIDKIKNTKNWNFLIGTNNLFKVHRQDEINPEKSLMLGPVRTIPNEFPNINCQLIDLDEELTYEELSSLTLGDQSRVLAERHGTLFEQYLAPIHETRIPTSAFQPSGTYVLTGGLGGLGKSISHYLLKQYPGITLILLGRTALEAVQSQEAFQKLLNLATRIGGTLSYVQVDLGNHAAVFEWAENTKKEFENLRGILHLAGIQGGGMINFNDRKGIEPAFEAKVDGSDSLIAAFASYPLDFFVMSSSSASLFGFFGLMDYSTANAYMDQLAQSQTNTKTKYISINWDMWTVDGMGTGTGLGEAAEALRAKNKTYAIEEAQGHQVLEQVLQWDLPQVAVLTRTPEEIINDSNLKQGSILGILSEEDTMDTVADETLEEHIIRIWKRIFERPDIGLHDNFFQIGGHSLSGVMFINKMKTRFFNLQLSLNEIFDYPTPQKIALLIEERVAKSSATERLKERIWHLDSNERIAELTEDLLSEINQLLEQTLSSKDAIPETHLADVANHLYFHLKEELELPVYAYEISKEFNIEELAAYLSKEFEAFHSLNPIPQTNGQLPQVKAGLKTWKPEGKPKIQESIFVCSAPRAGSTLLRLMFSCHTKLMAAPELWLLGSQTMSEWSKNVPGHVIQHGGVSSLLQSSGSLNDLEAQHQVQQYIDQDTSCFDVFQYLRALNQEKIFIDKTPNYYKDLHVFDRIEDGFENAKYIHLIRHPYATIDSIIKNRIYSLYEAYRNYPIKAAEHIWHLHNENIRQFIEKIDPTRSMVVKYEDLVSQPELTMKQLCTFIGIPYEPQMINPYSTAMMIVGDGDPNILNHDDIDPSLADAWKRIEFDPALSEVSTALAKHYEYQLSPNEVSASNELVTALIEEDLDDLLNQLA